jgi:hypothetical protein
MFIFNLFTEVKCKRADKEDTRRHVKQATAYAYTSAPRLKLALSVGNRVLAAMLAYGLCRVTFTTNFDSVMEKAMAKLADSASRSRRGYLT